MPALLVAVTVNVYSVPYVKPVNVVDVPVVVAVKLSGEDVTVYKVIGDPPLEAGGVHEIVAVVPGPPVLVTPVGAPGTVAGVIEFDGPDAEPVVSPPFVEDTVNV